MPPKPPNVFSRPARVHRYPAKGNEENIFDRVDYQVSKADSIQLNLGFTRSWFQNPISFDNVVHTSQTDPAGNPLGATDQRSQIRTFNVAPSWTRLLSTKQCFTLTVYAWYSPGGILGSHAYNLNRMSVKLRYLSAFLALTCLAVRPSFSQSPDDKQASFAAHIQKAKGYLDEKRPDLAIPELEAAAKINPDSVETQGNLGVLLYFQGKTTEAIPHLRAAVERQSGLAKIQGLLGLAEVHTLNVEDGRKDLEAAFPLVPDLKFKVEVGLVLLTLYTQSGDLEQASTLVAQLRKAAPDNPEVLYAAYRTYSDLAGESMLALSLAAPDSAQMHQLMAHEDVRQGNTNAAVEQFRKAIKINPHLPGVHFEFAELLNSSQDESLKKQAEQEYQAALKENPQDEKAILRLAEIDGQRGKIEKSAEGYAKAMELQPGDADAKLGLAKALMDMNQPEKALPLLEQAVQLEPTNAIAHYRLGTLYRKKGRAEDSKKELELYKKYKDMKENLRTLYKELQIQPEQISVDEQQDNLVSEP